MSDPITQSYLAQISQSLKKIASSLDDIERHLRTQ